MTVIEQHDDECIHGMFPPSSCTICTGKDRARTGIVWRGEARYHGRLGCGHVVEIGDTICQTTDVDFVCESCGAVR